MRQDVALFCDGSHSALDVLQIIGKDRKLVQLVADLCRQDICNSGWRESTTLCWRRLLCRNLSTVSRSLQVQMRMREITVNKKAYLVVIAFHAR